MKRTLIIASVLFVVLSGVGACQGETLKVGATPVPHAEILEMLVPLLEQEGIALDIVEFTDYVRPNLALQEGELDANFFQHVPYLESFNLDAGTDLFALVGVHVEPRRVRVKFGSLMNCPTVPPSLPTRATRGRALLLLATPRR